MAGSRSAQVEGGIPLVGSTRISGSRSLALKVFYASVLCGEECVLLNVPKAKYVLDDLEIAEKLNIHTYWASGNKLVVNSHDLDKFAIPDSACGLATSAFFVPALIHKFGKAVMPKGPRWDQYVKIWEGFGMEIRQDFNYLYVEAAKLHSGEIILPYGSRILTDLSIITALFIPGESIILNASTDVETDDLIGFCNMMGAEVRRAEHDSIIVKGSGVFKGVSYTVPYDREEAAFFITATLLTDGNITLVDIERARLLPFINWLSKIGANYEFSGQDMRIWHNPGIPFENTDITVSPHPGFIPDFVPVAVLLSCYSEGKSVITVHPKTNNLSYIRNFNQTGADINMERCSDNIEIHVNGPVTLQPGLLKITGLKDALVNLLYAVSIEGNNELKGIEIIDAGYENIIERLRSLGASIYMDSL